MSNITVPEPGILKVRAYCTDCGKLLMESNPLTKKQLLANWNNTVMGALSIACKDCGNKAPNVHLELRIYNSKFNTETLPENYKPLKLSKKAQKHLTETFLNAFKLKAMKFKSDHPEQAEEIDKHLESKILDITESGEVYEPIPAEELPAAIKAEVERRKKLFGRR